MESTIVHIADSVTPIRIDWIDWMGMVSRVSDIRGLVNRLITDRTDWLQWCSCWTFMLAFLFSPSFSPLSTKLAIPKSSQKPRALSHNHLPNFINTYYSLHTLLSLTSLPPCSIKTSQMELDSRDDTAVVQERVINEEYKIWKKNSPFLYEYVSQLSALPFT